MAQILSWLKDRWLQWTTCFRFSWEWDLLFSQEIPQTVSFCHYMKLSAVEDAGLPLLYNLPIFNCCWWFVLWFLFVYLFSPTALLLLFCILKILYLPALFTVLKDKFHNV